MGNVSAAKIHSKRIHESQTIRRMITAAQARAARAMLNLSVRQVGELAGVSQATVVAFEGEKRRLHKSTIETIQRAFESKGVIFSDDGGVRLTP